MLSIVFINDRTGSERIGNYDYSVYVNKRKIAKGRVTGHFRPDGWKQLVCDLQQQLAKAEDVTIENTLMSLYELIKEKE